MLMLSDKTTEIDADEGAADATAWDCNEAPLDPALVAGTRVATARGEMLVQALVPGDIAVLADGGRAMVQAVGRARIDCPATPQPWEAWPICIATGALGADRPHRPLMLSPGHGLYVDGVLIPARCLLDGHAVFQRQVQSVEYWRVTLDRPGLLIAEGMAVQTPTPSPGPLRTVEAGLLVEAVRARITRRRAA